MHTTPLPWERSSAAEPGMAARRRAPDVIEPSGSTGFAALDPACEGRCRASGSTGDV